MVVGASVILSPQTGVGKGIMTLPSANSISAIVFSVAGVIMAIPVIDSMSVRSLMQDQDPPSLMRK